MKFYIQMAIIPIFKHMEIHFVKHFNNLQGEFLSFAI
jgi:hypothetical protein